MANQPISSLRRAHTKPPGPARLSLSFAPLLPTAVRATLRARQLSSPALAGASRSIACLVVLVVVAIVVVATMCHLSARKPALLTSYAVA